MSNRDLELSRIWRELNKQALEIAQRPIKIIAPSALPDWKLDIFDGNTVYNSGGTTLYGIKRAASEITSVPTLYDPGLVYPMGPPPVPGDFTAIDGIGRAKLWINGFLQSSFVLVVHHNVFQDGIFNGLVNPDRCQSFATVSLPVDGSDTDTVTCYIPFFE
jgi:hypothetical protein